MSQIQEVKEASDIVEIIGARVSLQRSGKYFRACCPFHSEKSPSFFVDEVLQRYKCFGCGESGDVLTFLEKYEGLSFSEALEELAQRAGITLQKYTKTPADTKKERILEVLNLAQNYYHYLLTQHTAGSVAREYLKERKISQESVRLFQLGYALDQWEGLLKFLHKKKKYSIEILLEAGLIIAGKNGRYYDRFRGRIMFPLRDKRGVVVGFSGRKLQGDEKDAKYINSPETLVYHKSKMLFGYSELYQEIRKAGYIVVVEGEFDVISSVQAHMNAVVALKGSALTQDHVTLLERTVSKVLLALDTDSAGVSATKKSIAVLQKTDIQLRVIRIPAGKDPDEFAKENPAGWRSAIKESVTAYEFLIIASFQQHDQTTPEGKQAIMKDLVPVLAEIEHMVELEHYSKEIAQKLGVKLESVVADIQQYKRQNRFGAQKKTQRTDAYLEKQKTSTRSPEETIRQRLEKYSIFLLFQSEKNDILAKARSLLDLHEVHAVFSGTQLVTLVSSIVKYTKPFNAKTFAQALPADMQEALFAIHSNPEFIKAISEIDIQAEWDGTLKKLKQLAITEKKQTIIAEIAQIDEIETLTPEQQKQHDALLKELATLNTLEKV